jgi:hypothetical protein
MLPSLPFALPLFRLLLPPHFFRAFFLIFLSLWYLFCSDLRLWPGKDSVLVCGLEPRVYWSGLMNTVMNILVRFWGGEQVSQLDSNTALISIGVARFPKPRESKIRPWFPSEWEPRISVLAKASINLRDRPTNQLQLFGNAQWESHWILGLHVSADFLSRIVVWPTMLNLCETADLIFKGSREVFCFKQQLDARVWVVWRVEEFCPYGNKLQPVQGCGFPWRGYNPCYALQHEGTPFIQSITAVV